MSRRFPALPGDWNEMIVLWGNGPWDGHRLGAQFLAEALSAHHPVLFVDPPTSLTAVVRGGASAIGDAAREPRLSVLGPGLARLRPLGPPGKTRPGLRTVTQRWTVAAVQRAVAALGGTVRAVISGYSYCQPFGHCGERWRVFRASDDFTVGAELGVPVDFMAKAHGRMAALADAVVCVSPTLCATWRSRGHDPVLVPNGCDVDRLREARCLPRPADIALPDPIVGYVGQLASRIDVDLLRAVAVRGHSLLLVGGRRPDFDLTTIDDVLERPNVQWLGARPYDQVPAYVGAIHVGLVPYADSAFNRASFPLKLLEYLGAGAPVVSTELPAVGWLGTDLIRVGRGARGFADAVDGALAVADDEAERRRRLDFAAGHSWERRARSYLAVLDELDRRAGGSPAGGCQSASA